MRTLHLATLVLPTALLLAACEVPTMTKGFSGPGCYDYRGVREPTVPTPAECRAIGLEWYDAPTKDLPPARR